MRRGGSRMRCGINDEAVVHLRCGPPTSGGPTSNCTLPAMIMPLPVSPKLRPPLDPGFLPAALWNRAYRDLVTHDPGARPFALALVRSDGSASVHHDRV